MNISVQTLIALSLLALGLQAAFPPWAAAVDAVLAPPSTAGTMPPADKTQVQRRLESVATLVEESSAAKQIEASGNAEAIAHRAKARDLHAQAGEAFRKGDYETAQKLLFEATRQMVNGVRLAAPAEVTGRKKLTDFNNRMESIKVLLAAQKRISVEKKQGAKGQEVSRQIEAMIKEAATLKDAGKVEEGRVVLDRAYVLTKTAIAGMRSGETLVRSLDFATKKDEYVYEIDRNDTHKMLVEMLLKEKRVANPNLDSQVRQHLDKAASLRAMAEEHAAKGDYISGISRLEESTQELVRAIRRAGVFIPG
ncbi:MAG: hypothetical protein Q7U91_17330 [Sideroxyarcus sp.]|nr:hypothetical protein [Sideroxyarcus sp.]